MLFDCLALSLFIISLKALYRVVGYKSWLKFLCSKRRRREVPRLIIKFFDRMLTILRLNCMQRAIAYLFFLRWFGYDGQIFVTITEKKTGHSWVESDFFYNPTRVSDEDRKFAIPIA